MGDTRYKMSEWQEYKKGMIDKAIAEYKKVISISPNFIFAHYNLGVAYHKKGMTDEAIGAYKKAIGIGPNYASAHLNLGMEYYIKKLGYVGADHLYKAGLIYLKQGDREGALKAYEVLKIIKAEELQKALFKQLYPDIK